ncbi:hypothetical protein PSWA111526_16385 [Pseudomonas wadenswilerensis]|uniref:Uncharacterized protein n=1 Tax=Pseudomonas wadenswilerensis TaxID=1785161 RepID=A0A380T2A6_9PSED|nr:hypothetical protein CCOS864_03109 [Pseudomonas wadenswilerensis]
MGSIKALYGACVLTLRAAGLDCRCQGCGKALILLKC